MRLSRINSERGGVAVFIMIAVPLMVAMLSLVIDAGRVAVARARLQAAADRAAYAGAAVLADAMNNIAAENWRIHRAWRVLAGDFAADAQQMSGDAARQRIERYEARRDEAMERIGAVNSSMAERARAVALDLLKINAPASTGDGVVAGAVSLADDLVPEEQIGHTSYGSVDGINVFDPESVQSGGYDGLKFLVKRRGSDARVGIFAAQIIQPMLLGRTGARPFRIEASAAAQAFGGSVDGFARKETDSVDDAESSVSEGGYDALYRAALVPMWTQGAAGAGMMH